MPEFDYQPLDSSLLSHAAYDPETRTLAVRFKSGGPAYHYQDVPPEEHEALMGASSPGQHFHANIRSTYRWSPG